MFVFRYKYGKDDGQISEMILNIWSALGVFNMHFLHFVFKTKCYISVKMRDGPFLFKEKNNSDMMIYYNNGLKNMFNFWNVI